VSQHDDQYRPLFEANPLPMWVYATDTFRFLAVNAAAVARYGWTRDEFLGMTIFDMRPPEDAAAVRASAERAPGGLTDSGPWRHRLKGGREIRVRVSSHPLTFDGHAARLVLAHDVTAQLEAEDRLRESERRLAATLDAGGMGSWAWQLGQNRSVWNRKEFELLGLPPQEGEVDTDLFFHLVHPDDRPALQGAISESLSAGDFHSEFRVVTPAGEVRWLEGSGRVFRDSHGDEQPRMFGVNFDITERKRAEAAVRRQTEGLRLLSEAAAELLAAVDPIRLVHDLFARVSAHLGCDVFFHYEAEGEELRLAAAGGLSDDHRRRFARLQLGQAICGHAALTRSMVCMAGGVSAADPGGQFARDVGLHAYASNPQLAGDRQLGTLSFGSRTKREFDPHELDLIRTVTHYAAIAKERLQAEERLRVSERLYRAVVEHSTDGLVLAARGVGITFSTPAVTAILGYSAAELARLTPEQMHHPDDLDRVWAVIRDAEAHPGRTVSITHRMRHRDGSWRWIDSTLTDWTDDRAVGSLVINLRDVTDRETSRERERRVEEKLRQSTKLEAIGQLAGGVAHDFNNLLTVVGGFSELVLGDLPADHPHRTALLAIRDAGERGAALTRQLLSFSRKQVTEPVVLDLNATVARVETLLRRLIPAGVRIVTALNAPAAAVLIDPVQAEQVLINLAVNARDAMPDGGRLIIETANRTLTPEDPSGHPDLPAGGYVRLSVTDTGCGMTPEVKARMFEPFFTTKEAGKGTGLGLATVYGIVRQAGGQVTVYSEVGMGSTFHILLPQVGASAAVADAPAELPVMGTETILLVEDEPGVRDITHRILSNFGYTVLVADGGATALRLVAELAGTIHLMLTDVVMPEMNGRQLAASARERLPHLRVLFMSGYTDDAVVQNGILTAADAFVQKPFTPHALAAKVRAALDAVEQ
jgi:two-component system cell cycle sensor histidine kinase/response regulator CckA